MFTQNLPESLKFISQNNQASILINFTESGFIRFEFEKGKNILSTSIKYQDNKIEIDDKRFIVKMYVKKNTNANISLNILNKNTEFFIKKNILFEKCMNSGDCRIVSVDCIEKNNIQLVPNFFENKINFQEILSKQNNTINQTVSNNIQNTPVIQNTLNMQNLKEELVNVSKINENINPKEILVVTVNFGSYDSTPTNIKNINDYDYFDWIYLTDNKNIISNGWIIISDSIHHLENVQTVHNNDENRMYSKFYKTQILNLESYFYTYKYIIWIDASIVITNNNFVKDILLLLKTNSSTDFFIFDHAERDSIQLEYLQSMLLPKYANQPLDVQVKNYYSDGYTSGLYESGFFIYKVNKKISIMLDDWWEEIQNYGYQCQISLPYVLQKNNIKPYLLNESNFKKGVQQGEGSIWKNKLVGYVRNHT